MGTHSNPSDPVTPNTNPLTNTSTGSNFAGGGPAAPSGTPNPQIEDLLRDFYNKNYKKEFDALKKANDDLKKANDDLKKDNDDLKKRVSELEKAKGESDVKVQALIDEVRDYKAEVKKFRENSAPVPKEWDYFFVTKMKDGSIRFSPNLKNPKNDKIFDKEIGSRDESAIKIWLKTNADFDEPETNHVVVSKPCWIDFITNEPLRLLTPEEAAREGA